MRILPLAMVLAAVALTGCDSPGGSALLGGAAGAAAGAGTYEYRLREARQQVEADREAGRIDQDEYEIRMDQINDIGLID